MQNVDFMLWIGWTQYTFHNHCKGLVEWLYNLDSGSMERTQIEGLCNEVLSGVYLKIWVLSTLLKKSV